MKDQCTHKYDDIINLPHPTSKKHPRMSLYARTAQFSPFAALTGHEAAIKETVRQTDAKPVSYTHLDVYKRQMLYRAKWFRWSNHFMGNVPSSWK